jgi:hypothetical protein
MSRALLSCLLLCPLLAFGQATPEKDRHAPERARIETAKMLIEFDDGWLALWVNKETGERVEFGNPGLKRTDGEDRHYAPGPWWADWRKPTDTAATATQWSTQVRQVDETAVTLTQSAERAGGQEVHAVQWAVRVPYAQVDAVHFPKGMPPARMSGKGCLDLFLAKSNQFSGRLAEDSGGGAWRLRFYQIQARTGGLLVYMDDPALDHLGNLEFKQGADELVISNRSFRSPPWPDKYTGGRWVVRQYTGYTHVGARLYQEYLAAAYALKPLKDRPTAWVAGLGLVLVQAPWCEPLPVAGHRRPEYDYSANWEASLRAGEQWLDNLARVMPPDQVMIYTTQWRAVPNHDAGLQDNSIDPFFAIMCRKARQRGFHVQIHFNAINITSDSVCYERYFAHQAKLLGLDAIEGVVHNAYTGKVMGEKKGEGHRIGDWSARSGYDRLIHKFTMSYAHEGWRYLLAGTVLSAVKATGADALHLDVPISIPDMNSARYGISAQQGLRDFGRLLRRLLDENGLQHVAIGTEVTPPESLLAVTDYAQVTRGKSVQSFIDGLVQGKYRATEEGMIFVQTGKELAQTKLERERMERERSLQFDPAAVRDLVARWRELSEPAINSLALAPYVQAGPHLGTLGPSVGLPGMTHAAAYNRLVQGLVLWYSMAHDTLPFYGPPRAMFMDCPPYDGLDVIQRYRRDNYSKDPARPNGKVLDAFDYAHLALARFWGDQRPAPAPLAERQKGDIARYRLRDGRTLVVSRSNPTTLRWAFGDGQTLAEMDLFEGWRNDAVLMKQYEPLWLRNQIDDFVPRAP